MRGAPRATYRVQVTPDRPLSAVAERLDHLAQLGVSHVYLSPLLTSTPGSTHGYDVIDHHSIDEELDGMTGLLSLHDAASARGLALVLDIVPNHMAIPVPESLNTTLWSVLKDGPSSPRARWIDVDWSAERPLLLPVLGERIDEALDGGLITLDRNGGPDGTAVLRYFDHVLPVREGTEDLPLEELLDAQHYRLAYWKLADEELNYRRFFDVDTLVGIRVEVPEVFAETHALVVSLVRDGVVAGLRVDHPDGLADPRGYLRDLADATDDAWVVVEKILEGDEDLPSDWRCAGTTGYDAAARIGAVFVDPAASVVLERAFSEAVGDDTGFAEVCEQSRRDILTGLLATEVDRLAGLAHEICQGEVRLRDHSRRGLTLALVELLVAVPVYRVYVQAGEEPDDATVRALDAVAETASARLPERAPEVALLRDLALGRHGRSPLKDQFVRRFQQTCGPAVAKGVEDTAGFRWFPLVALADVGMSPDSFGIDDDALHAWATHRATRWPASLTGTSTHDSKRSEDVRARLAVLSEIPGEWVTTARAWSDTAGPFTTADGERDGRTEWLLWQTLVGAWPVDTDRLSEHLVKATREAKLRTSWVAPDDDYEKRLRVHVERVLADGQLMSSVAQMVERLSPGFATNVLGQRALTLLLPGIPDIYQGGEVVDLSLTDPDNRRAPDSARITAAAERVRGGLPDPVDLDAAKLHLTRVGLGLRAQHPQLVTGADYAPIVATGPAAEHVFGFRRGDVLVSVTRWALRLATSGGFRGTAVEVPHGRWAEVVTGRSFSSDGSVVADELYERWPVALLVREG
jgi:(1->4)-alpha-D-glucan 1-alpha-D-glucosylmutase